MHFCLVKSIWMAAWIFLAQSLLALTWILSSRLTVVHDFSKGLIKELLKDAAKRAQVIVKIKRLIHYFKCETKYEFRGMSVIITVSEDAWDARLIDLEYMYELKEEEREDIHHYTILGLKNIISLINSVFESYE